MVVVALVDQDWAGGDPARRAQARAALRERAMATAIPQAVQLLLAAGIPQTPDLARAMGLVVHLALETAMEEVFGAADQIDPGPDSAADRQMALAAASLPVSGSG